MGSRDMLLLKGNDLKTFITLSPSLSCSMFPITVMNASIYWASHQTIISSSLSLVTMSWIVIVKVRTIKICNFPSPRFIQADWLPIIEIYKGMIMFVSWEKWSCSLSPSFVRRKPQLKQQVFPFEDGVAYTSRIKKFVLTKLTDSDCVSFLHSHQISHRLCPY